MHSEGAQFLSFGFGNEFVHCKELSELCGADGLSKVVKCKILQT